MTWERNRLKKVLERRRNAHVDALHGNMLRRHMDTQPVRMRDDEDADDEHDQDKELKVPSLFRRTSSRRSERSSTGTYRLSSLNALCVDFGGRTSSHGIPFICGRSCCGPWVWSIIFILCSVCFIIQTYWTMSEYFQYRTIIEMQLKFEAAPFPAATVCNLNAFKYSELIQYDEIKEGFEIWERVINAREMNEVLKRDNLEKFDIRIKRELHFPIEEHELRGAVYSPVFVRCTCINTEQCVPNRNPLETNASVCMCFEDVTRGLIWPCYPTSVWNVKKCTQCTISNTCSDPDRPNATRPFGEEKPCLCQSISHHCMVHPKEEIRWWNPNNYTVYPVTEAPKPTETEEAFGLNELKDKGAITTQTKENLIFLVAALPRETRRNLSYTLNEFVLRCSFNSKDCIMERDFKLHMDPEYGNCYTFNFNDSVELKNSRAGPMYGLRLLLDVHQDDYLPTTEAAGVRLVVHEQDQEPFPDTFGYSAPTGFVSSFGLKTKVLQRLDSPWGSCSDFFRPDPYIYDEHYSPEGCHRNCFQTKVLELCGCGDPRFPLPNDSVRYCEARSVSDRRCLSNLTSESGGYHHLQSECTCMQPCTENVFETAYSAAAWPSKNFNIGKKINEYPELFILLSENGVSIDGAHAGNSDLLLEGDLVLIELIDDVFLLAMGAEKTLSKGLRATEALEGDALLVELIFAGVLGTRLHGLDGEADLLAALNQTVAKDGLPGVVVVVFLAAAGFLIKKLVVGLLGQLLLLNTALAVLDEVATVELFDVVGLLVVSTTELVVTLSVKVSADSALLVLVQRGELDLGVESVEVADDVLDVDLVVLALLGDAVLLPLLLILDLLAIDAKDHLFLALLHHDLVLGTDHLERLLSLGSDLLHENGEFRLLAAAVLGKNGVAGGQRGLEEGTVEGLDLLALDDALGTRLLLDELGDVLHRADSSIGLTDVGAGNDGHVVRQFEILDHDDLLGSPGGRIPGHLHIGGKLELHVVADLLLAGLDSRLPHLPDLDEAHSVLKVHLVLGGQLVVDEDLVLVELGGTVQLLGLGQPVLLPVDTAHPLLLGTALLSLDPQKNVVLFFASPTDLDGSDVLAMGLVEHLLERSRHLGVEGFSGQSELPWLVLLFGGHTHVHLHTAEAHVFVALAADSHLNLLGLGRRLHLQMHAVAVSLVSLELLDVVVEGTTTVRLVLLLVLAALGGEELGVLVEEVVEHQRLLHLDVLEDLESQVGDDLLGNVLLGLDDNIDDVLSVEEVVGVLSADDDLQSVALEDALEIVLLDVLELDGGLLGLRVLLLAPLTVEDDGAGSNVYEVTVLNGSLEGVLYGELLLPVDLDLSVDGGVDASTVEKLHSRAHDRAHDLDLGDVGPGNLGLGDDANTESVDAVRVLRLQIELDGSMKSSHGRVLGGEDDRHSEGGGKSADGLVEESSSSQTETASENVLEFGDVELSLAKNTADHLRHGVDVHGNEGVVHILVAEVDHGTRLLGVDTAVVDLQALEEGAEEFGGTGDGGTLSTNDDVLQSRLLNGFQELGDELVEVVLHESDLGEVLVPLSSKDSLEGGGNLLGKNALVGEEGGEVPVSSHDSIVVGNGLHAAV